jgi:hypothetical protein
MRRILQEHLNSVAERRDPSGVRFDPAGPPVVFEASNYIRGE